MRSFLDLCCTDGSHVANASVSRACTCIVAWTYGLVDYAGAADAGVVDTWSVSATNSSKLRTDGASLFVLGVQCTVNSALSHM